MVVPFRYVEMKEPIDGVLGFSLPNKRGFFKLQLLVDDEVDGVETQKWVDLCVYNKELERL